MKLITGNFLMFLALGTELVYCTKINLMLLYEFLCPACHVFIELSLYPNYDNFKDHMNLSLVPFGNANILDNKTIKCQHGPNECKGNRLQSCVFNTIPTEVKKQLDFVQCQIEIKDDPLVSGRKCAEKLNIPWDPIQSCYDGQLGTDLQLEAGKLTTSFNNHWVPWIIYDNISNYDMQNLLLENFVKAFCGLINNDSPVCK